jgi:type I restriction enzyme S subunit
MPTDLVSGDWIPLSFDQCVETDRIPRRPSIQQRNYKAVGRYPIVDQGAALIAGYCDDDSVVYRDELPLILFGDHTRVFKFLDFPFATGADGTKLLKPNRELVHPLFLYYALRSLNLPNRGYNRHFRLLREQVIHAPKDPEEQKRIGSVLQALESQASLESAICEKLATLKSASMAKLFRDGLRGEPPKQTEIGEIPESWDVRRLGDIASIGNGSTPKRTNEAYWNNGCIPWITSTKIHEVVITRADEFVTEEAFRQCHLPMVPRKSLVVAVTGQGKTLGNVALLETDTCINQHLAYVQFHIPSAHPEFYLFFLQSLYSYFRQISSSGGSTKGALTCGFIANLKVPVPRSEEQQEIAELLLLLTRRHQIGTKRSEALSSLFGALLQQLMTGAIRVKDLDVAEASRA